MADTTTERKPKLGDAIILVNGMTGRDCVGFVTEVFKNGDIGCFYARDEYPYMISSFKRVPHSIERIAETFRYADEDAQVVNVAEGLNKAKPATQGPLHPELPEALQPQQEVKADGN